MVLDNVRHYDEVRQQALEVVERLARDDESLRDDLTFQVACYGDGLGGGRGVEEATLAWWLEGVKPGGPTAEDLRTFKIGLAMGIWAASAEAIEASLLPNPSVPKSVLSTLGLGNSPAS